MRRGLLLSGLAVLLAGCATAGHGPAFQGPRDPTPTELSRIARTATGLPKEAGVTLTPTCKALIGITPDGQINAGVTQRDDPGCPARIYIVVSAGALADLDDGQLRAILAHELGHVALGHQAAAARRLAAEQTAQIGAQIAQVAAAFIPGLGGAISQIVGLSIEISTPLVARGFDREQEREADRWAAGALLKTGGRPACLGLASAFERMARGSESSPSLMDTHPHSDERARDIRQVCGMAA